ncbi:unnamed protein product [Peniophora sp. CBMAI 1063]|nr:unnamed protein product [Peniophora sp. CBMAI 1063]
MLSYGSVAVAIVNRQVVLVTAAHPHDQRDRYLDVYTYTSAGRGVFLATQAPCARIAAKDLLVVFPDEDAYFMPARDVLELPMQAYHEYVYLRERLVAQAQRKWHERKLWAAWKGKFM